MAVSFLGFLLSIIASLTMMRAISLNVGAAYTRNFQPIERPANWLATRSFLIAVAALVAFVPRNLF